MAVTVADIRARFSADTSNAERDIKKLGGSFTDLGKKAKAAGKEAGGGLEAIEKSLKSFGSGATAAGTTLSLALTAPLVGLGALAFSAGEKLNKGMANIASLNIASDRVKELKSNIQDMQIEFGKTAEDLTAGTYQIISAWGDSADTAKILATNVKIASAGVSTLSEAVDLTSAVTLAWGDSSLAAIQHVGDLALKTVELGKTNLPELASAIGKVTSMSKNLSISQEEMFAVFASASGVIGTTAEVSTGYRGILQSLQSPTETMTKLMTALGFANGEAMVKQLGLGKTLEVVGAAVRATGGDWQPYISSIEGSNLATALSGPLLEKFIASQSSLSDVLGKTDAAFKAQTEGENAAGVAMEKAQQKLNVFLERISDGMGPALLAFADLLDPVINKLLDLSKRFESLDPTTQKWVVGIAAGVAAIGPLLLAVGALATGLAALLPVLGAVGAAFSALLGPIGLVAAGLGILVAYNWDSITGAASAFTNYAAAVRDAGFGSSEAQQAIGLLPQSLQGITSAVDKTIGGLISYASAVRDAGFGSTESQEAISLLPVALQGFASAADITIGALVNYAGAVRDAGFGSTEAREAISLLPLSLQGIVKDLDNVAAAFNSAGGGANGFFAALSSLSGGALKVDVSGLVTTLTWGDYVGVLDWSKYIFQIRWGDFIGILSWNDKILLLNWNDFLAKFDWSNWVVSLKWGDYVGKLAWTDIVAAFNGWSNYIEHLTWKQFVHDLVDWGPFVGKLTWDSVVTSLSWSLYVTKIVWTDYVAPLTWRSVLTIIDWNQYATKLVWSEFITKLTWTNVSTFNWAEFIPKLTWLNYITPVGWLSYIAQLTWDTYIKPLSWAQFAEKLNWLNYVTPVGWLNYITVLTWDKFVSPVSWDAFVEKLTWSNFVANVSWTDFLEKLAWSAFVPSFSWASFITSIDLRSYVPAFPGWTAILSALGFGGAPAQGPPAPAKGDPEVFFGNAAGTSSFAGGWTWVGERGAELMKLPRGTQIASHENSMKLIGHMADGNTGVPTGLSSDQSTGFNKFVAAMAQGSDKIAKAQQKASDKIAKSLEKTTDKISADLKSVLQSVPGLFKTSPVTQQQMDLAKLGVPQNFADDWIRQLTDTVVNGVHWDGVDIKDAAARAGLDPGLPAKAILEMVTQKWNDQSFFADKKNLDLINMDAIKAAMAQQAASKLGQQNIFALFGIKPDDAQGQAVSLGNTVGTGVQQGLTDTLSKASSKDGKGIDMGSGLVNALKASLTDSTAFDTVGPAILKKIADSWKTINTDVDFVGGLASAFDVQLSTKNAIESFQAIGGKIAKILKQGIDEYFKNAAIADAIAKSMKPTAPKGGIPADEIPKHAFGTSYWRGGLSWVGERGAELVNLPRGAQVIPHNRSMQLAGAGGNTYNVTVNAVVDNQIDVHDLAYRMVSILKRKGG